MKKLRASLPGRLIFGVKGDPGAVFRPNVDEEGTISWTNNGGLANPAPQNIRGPKGEKGDNIFLAEYGVSTYEQVTAAMDKGLLCVAEFLFWRLPMVLCGVKWGGAYFSGYDPNGQQMVWVSLSTDGIWDNGSVPMKVVETIGEDSLETEIPTAKAVWEAVAAVKIFVAEYGVTAFAEIRAAWEQGKACFCTEGGSLAMMVSITADRAEFCSLLAPGGLAIGYSVTSGDVWSAESEVRIKTKIVNALSTDDQIPTAKAVYNAILNAEGDIFVGDNSTTVAEFNEAFASKKACFMIRPQGGSGNVMWVAYNCSSAFAHFYNITSGGAVQHGVLDSNGEFATTTAEGDIFVGDYGTTVTEFNEAFASKKPCFMIRPQGGSGNVMWVAYNCSSAFAHFYNITSGGAVQHGVLDSNGEFTTTDVGISDDKIAEAVKEYLDKKPAAGSGALTTAQIDALHGMFKVCACDDSKDVSGAYAAFLAAFGITDSGEEEPDTPVEPDEPEKTLISISAVYSGGDVAVGTAVADLTGIVVTAHYSDGSSETVTGYTLSGTIAEGSNTVTVSYGGKTTTFTVTGVAESGGETDEVKMLNMVNKGDGTNTSAFYEGDADSTQLTAWNGNWYKSNAVADEDTVVNIAFAADSNNANLFYYAAQIKQEDYKKFYYVEQLGTAMTTETVKSYTVRAGYELVFLVSNSSGIATLNVTYTDGIFTDVIELYTNLVGGYTLNAYLKSSDGSITPNWTKQNTSDLIDISAVDAVHIWSIANGNVMEQRNLTYCFYDESEVFISGGDAPGNADAITAVVVPDSAKYMRVGGSSSSTGKGVYVGINPAPYRYEFVAFK